MPSQVGNLEDTYRPKVNPDEAKDRDGDATGEGEGDPGGENDFTKISSSSDEDKQTLRRVPSVVRKPSASTRPPRERSSSSNAIQMPKILTIDVARFTKDFIRGLLFGGWRKMRPDDPVFRLLEELSKDKEQRKWKGLMLISAIMKTVLIHQSSNLVFQLTQLLYTRADAMPLMRRGLAVCFGAALQSGLSRYAREQLNILYRSILTKRIHREYFKHQRYYHIVQTLPPTQAISDPEERMGREVASMASRLATFAQLVISSAPIVVWFTTRLYRKAGWKLAILPHLYLLVAYEVAQRIFPKNIGILHRNIAGAEAAYRQAAVRVHTNSEVITSMQGEQREKEYLHQKSHAVSEGEEKLAHVQFKFDLTFKLAYTYGFRPWYIIALLLHLMSTSSHSSHKLANLRLIQSLLIEMLIANGNFLTMHATHAHIKGLAKRLVNFMDLLEKIEPSKAIVHESRMIEFENVDVVTPTGNLLVKDLNFTVRDGDALLLTGHNGAGKSSIFRCLGGLWAVGGRISKPEGDIFYLPQKPYNIHGTLKAQVTYPKPASEIPNSILELLLKQVNLDHLIPQHRNKTVASWDKVLSMGEQQRLAICRLFFHRPRFAVLDECTSAVAAHIEEQLYERLQEYQIAYITICHRPALKRFHNENLVLTGDGKGGWDTIAIPQEARNYKKKMVELKRSCSLVSDFALAEIPEPKKSLPVVKRMVWSKLWILFKLMIAGSKGSKWKLVTLSFLVAIRTLSREISVNLSSRMINCMVKGNFRSLFYLAVINLLHDYYNAWNEDYGALYQKRLVHEWYENLADLWKDKWFEKRRFYEMQHLDKRVTDADHRGTTEIKEFCDKVAKVWTSVVPPIIDLAWFGWRLHGHVGLNALSLLYLYNFCCGVLIRQCAPNWNYLLTKEKELESDFKFQHTRLRHHAESIAFFRGDKMEESLCDHAYRNLENHMINRQTKESIHQFWIALINRDVSLGNRMFGFPDVVCFFLQRIQLSNSEDWAQTNWYTESAVRHTMSAFSSLFGASSGLAQLLATSHRLMDLYDILDATELLPGKNIDRAKPVSENLSIDDSISFKDVEIRTPGTGLVLANNISFDCQTLLVTGRNGSGKTALFRVLRGLWPIPTGNIKRPEPLFLVPQYPYMAPGNLRDQVTYPHTVPADDIEEEAKMHEALRKVDLAFLIEREGWNSEQRWDEVLSLGEQQRICLARAFYQQCKYVVLDECTSAIAADAEIYLYQRLHEANMKMISITQRLAGPLRKYHEIEISLGANNARGHEIHDLKESASRTIIPRLVDPSSYPVFDATLSDKRRTTSTSSNVLANDQGKSIEGAGLDGIQGGFSGGAGKSIVVPTPPARTGGTVTSHSRDAPNRDKDEVNRSAGSGANVNVNTGTDVSLAISSKWVPKVDVSPTTSLPVSPTRSSGSKSNTTSVPISPDSAAGVLSAAASHSPVRNDEELLKSAGVGTGKQSLKRSSATGNIAEAMGKSTMPESSTGEGASPHTAKKPRRRPNKKKKDPEGKQK